MESGPRDPAEREGERGTEKEREGEKVSPYDWRKTRVGGTTLLRDKFGLVQ